MGFLKRLFSAPEVVASTVQSAVRGLDDIGYTEQEKAEKTAAAQQIYQAMWMAAVPSALSRRIIATAVTFVWTLLVILLVIQGGYFGNGEGSAAAFTFQVLKEIVAVPFSIIVGFYFLSQVVTKATK